MPVFGESDVAMRAVEFQIFENLEPPVLGTMMCGDFCIFSPPPLSLFVCVCDVCVGESDLAMRAVEFQIFENLEPPVLGTMMCGDFFVSSLLLLLLSANKRRTRERTSCDPYTYTHFKLFFLIFLLLKKKIFSLLSQRIPKTYRLMKPQFFESDLDRIRFEFGQPTSNERELFVIHTYIHTHT
jgi:hypothetical protein